MKVIDKYDFDKNLKERYVETIFYQGNAQYIGKSHGYSYLYLRNQYKEMGDIMGLDILTENQQ